jgi:UDP-N-acetylmuramyl tripeptide synthase
VLVKARGAGLDVAFERDGALVLVAAGEEAVVASVAEVPSTMGGAARYNVANALGAILVAHALGLTAQDMARGLAAFASTPAGNPGRANVFEIGGAKVLVDFAHNPHGLSALLQAAASLPAKRRLVLFGQAGDRDDASIRALARTVWDARPDRVIVKEMPRLLRGREPGSIPAILEEELLLAGAPREVIAHAPTELEGVRQALAWAEAGDLLVLTIHSDRKQVLADLAARASR